MIYMMSIALWLFLGSFIIGRPFCAMEISGSLSGSDLEEVSELDEVPEPLTQSIDISDPAAGVLHDSVGHYVEYTKLINAALIENFDNREKLSQHERRSLNEKLKIRIIAFPDDLTGVINLVQQGADVSYLNIVHDDFKRNVCGHEALLLMLLSLGLDYRFMEKDDSEVCGEILRLCDDFFCLCSMGPINTSDTLLAITHQIALLKKRGIVPNFSGGIYNTEGTCVNVVTPLHLAIFRFAVSLTSTLLANGASPQVRDKKGRVSLDCARTLSQKLSGRSFDHEAIRNIIEMLNCHHSRNSKLFLDEQHEEEVKKNEHSSRGFCICS